MPGDLIEGWLRTLGERTGYHILDLLVIQHRAIPRGNGSRKVHRLVSLAGKRINKVKAFYVCTSFLTYSGIAS
jgi:hypothetical protein